MSDNLYSLGKNSKTTILAIEENKLSIEFEATVTIKCGQPVKLTQAGKLAVWTKADSITLLIGHAYSEGGNGDLITVFMRSHLLIYALSSEAISCATPVTPTDWNNAVAVDGGELDGTTGYNRVEQVGADTAFGWALDEATGADELIRVALFH